jgi:hypothetical protein
MKRSFFAWFPGLVLGLVLVSFFCKRAAAEEPVSSEANVEVRRDVTRFLPSTSSAAAGTQAGVTNAWGGYDGAARTPVFSVGAEVRIVRRLSLIAGVAYTSANASDPGLRPRLGARVQVLEEAKSGIDASAAFVVRQDRFTSEDGLFQGSIALGRSFGATSAVVNIVYGQDGEGDDHEAELRLAGVRRIRGGLHAGVEARYMHSVDSTDPHRAALGTPSMEAMAGPLVAYTAGSWVLVAEAAISTRQTSHLETGVTTLAGIGTTF